MSSVIKDLYLHKKMVKSSRRLNSVGRFYEQLLLALLCSVEYLTSPIQHLKRLMISFLAIEGKGLLVPCITKAKVYQDHKSLHSNFLPFGVRKPNVHVLIMCKPMYTAIHRGENRYRYKIVAVVVYNYFLRVSD